MDHQPPVAGRNQRQHRNRGHGAGKHLAGTPRAAPLRERPPRDAAEQAAEHGTGETGIKNQDRGPEVPAARLRPVEGQGDEDDNRNRAHGTRNDAAGDQENLFQGSG